MLNRLMALAELVVIAGLLIPACLNALRYWGETGDWLDDMIQEFRKRRRKDDAS